MAIDDTHALETMPTTVLVKEMFGETRKLVKVEVALAVQDAKGELRKAKRAGIAAGIGLVTSILMLAMLCVAVVLAFGGTVLAALLVAAALFVITAGVGLYAYSAAPKKPLEHTRRRFESDLEELKEHIA
jgi:uncharacterized membrane protein YqjE